MTLPRPAASGIAGRLADLLEHLGEPSGVLQHGEVASGKLDGVNADEGARVVETGPFEQRRQQAFPAPAS